MRRITFLVYPGYSVMALATVSVFETANLLGREQLYELAFMSEDGAAITASSGIRLACDPLTDEPGDTLVIGGGTLPACPTPRVIELVRAAPHNYRRVAAICVGAFVLAEAGLLDGRRATTHWMHARALQAQYPAAKIDEDRIFINDGPIWTSAGMTAGLDLALALVEADHGTETAKSVARKLVLYQRRGGGQSQFSTLLELEPKSDPIQKALAYARENLHTPLDVSRLARAAHLSPRQFSRVFRAETGESPARAVERLRVETARTLMEHSIHPMEHVARQTGFSDRDHMRRAFLRAFGQPPQVLRRNARNEVDGR
jgi:transcriptional regulator GlxA family with amidase domain